MTIEGVMHQADGATLLAFTVDGIQLFKIHRPDDYYSAAQFKSIDDLRTWLQRALAAVEKVP